MVVKHVLDNGVTVLIDEMQDVRSFALGLFVRAGSGDEPAARQGLLDTSWSTSSSSGPAAGPTSRSRGPSTASAATSMPSRPRSTPGFYVHTLDTRFAEALDLMGTWSSRPRSTVSDIEMERGVILEEIGEANDNPDEPGSTRMFRSPSFWTGKKPPPRGAHPRDGGGRSRRSAGRRTTL
jgi:hypothetical protein